MPTHNVLLVPGFFGFGSFGDLAYFQGIKSLLERSFEQASLSVRVIEVSTLPTASIRVRAARVQEALAMIAACRPSLIVEVHDPERVGELIALLPDYESVDVPGFISWNHLFRPLS